MFVESFGRLRTLADVWDSGDFFRQLTRIWQFFNHLLFAREDIKFDVQWEWNHSVKAVHLIDKLKDSKSQGSGRTQPKSVIFSIYVGFLEMWVCLVPKIKPLCIQFNLLTRNKMYCFKNWKKPPSKQCKIHMAHWENEHLKAWWKSGTFSG
jgi:hypothetical protein